jgi:hypothetical protein
MADLTIEIMQICEKRSRPVLAKIGGYLQTICPGGDADCTCKGFKYRRNCKHIRELEEKTCSYFELVDGPPETEGVCPHCGGPLAYVRVGV